MITSKNFSGQTTPKTIAKEYKECNFTQPQSVKVGGKMQGVRLFPGDDTPRTFIDCNMVNCEPPPGSTLTGCNTVVVERDKDIGNGKRGDIIHGRFDSGTKGYKYKQAPVVVEREDEN